MKNETVEKMAELRRNIRSQGKLVKRTLELIKQSETECDARYLALFNLAPQVEEYMQLVDELDNLIINGK